MGRRRRSSVLRCLCKDVSHPITTGPKLSGLKHEDNLLIREGRDLLLGFFFIRIVLLVLLPVLSCGARHDDGVGSLGLSSLGETKAEGMRDRR